MADAARAQEIRAEVANDQVEMGEVVDVYVSIVNPKQASAPAPPNTRDFDIRINPNPPSVSNNISIINGRTTQQSTYTYRYTARPLRPGNLVIPPFRYQEAGKTLSSRPITISVGRAVSGPWVDCEIVAGKKTVFIGQPVDLTLSIYIRQFQQAGFGTMNLNDMWKLQDGATSLGVFADGTVAPQVQQVRRNDDSGVPRDFYRYDVMTTIYPNKSGPLDLGRIEFIYNYPVQLGRNLFGYSVERSRQVIGAPKMPELLVKPIPTEGRPPDYSGAIGEYSIITSAKPTDVPVGDPITLTMLVRGQGSLDRLTAPRLDRVESLTKDFEVSGDVPAGEIVGDRKQFVLTIRPLRESVKVIPAIPFSYFNPKSERFETALSRPIAIDVRPAQRLAMPDSAQGGASPGAGVLAPLVETTEGLLANFDDPEEILASQSTSIGPLAWIVLLAMPAAYLVTWFVHRRSERYRHNQALRRRSMALATAKKALSANGESASGDIRAALLGYVADCCNVPAGGLTRNDAVRLAREKGVNDDLVSRLDETLENLEFAQYGGGVSAVQDGAALASQLVSELDRAGLR
jgi:hypothetical protein